MRLGIYVGSFNPPHLGHKKVIDYVLEKDLVDKVLLLPTPNYWNKKDLVPINERIEMLKFYVEENIEVDSTHNNYPYTYEVLNSLHEDYKDDELYLIIGSDNLEKLHEWKHIEEILNYKIIVLKRNQIIKNNNINDSNIIYEEDFEFINVSSTEIRNGDSKYLHPKVKEYIKRNKLYENI